MPALEKKDVLDSFQVDPEESVETELKISIHRAYEMLITRGNVPAEQARDSIVNTLDILTRVGHEIASTTLTNIDQKQTLGPSYFSSRHKGLVELFTNSATNKLDHQLYKVETLHNQEPKKTAKQTMNSDFKTSVWEDLLSCDPDEVENVLLSGLMKVFKSAENFNGPLMDVFQEYQPLFEKLKLVYAQVAISALNADDGCYSCWMALDKTLEVIEDQKREEDTMGMMG
ncbi:hypothetical protein LTR37_002832 [Vermiconidia calcicola]|uniref:Uncharacterized protein n=1 Tax=Vermiconidia calcicola TaxID=1690605 RepID=A0ACC3NSA4_9PEZI|nr:hypothetical protein LTR37_002832 [Vermiconidia calcicola]